MTEHATFTATIVVDVQEGETPFDALADYLACNDIESSFELVESEQDAPNEGITGPRW